ncbi:MAG TPA: hypothetical protein VER14_01080, partial [Phototrophicaceae bacterium]|nr:hypothetical protein [Phototrophicaceae bacterium]
MIASIIFAEKIWSKGIWVARAAGVVFVLVGVLSIIGIISITAENESISLHHEMGDMVSLNSNPGKDGVSGNMDMDMANMRK